jgi:hypothetical protein
VREVHDDSRSASLQRSSTLRKELSAEVGDGLKG